MAIDPRATTLSAKMVRFEYLQFQWVAGEIEKRWKCTFSEEEKSLFMEDFLLHARILREFFVGSPKKDDIIAAHFLDDPSKWESSRGSRCKQLMADKERLDKKLAHLTYSRLTLDEKWDFEVIRGEIVDAMTAFLGLLPTDRVQWFR